jgi:hypothetical protein
MECLTARGGKDVLQIVWAEETGYTRKGSRSSYYAAACARNGAGAASASKKVFPMRVRAP